MDDDIAEILNKLDNLNAKLEIILDEILDEGGEQE
jgi:tetrahydromethanopterin S-methyltransferase subunit G